MVVEQYIKAKNTPSNSLGRSRLFWQHYDAKGRIAWSQIRDSFSQDWTVQRHLETQVFRGFSHCAQKMDCRKNFCLVREV